MEHEGQDCIVLRDPGRYAPSMVVLPQALVEIVALFDGANSVVDVQAAVMRRHGELVTRERIEELVEALDGHGFLDSPRFAELRKGIEDAFLGSATRPASHAGGAYPDGPDALRHAFDGFFDPPEGPGAIEAGATSPPAVTGIVAPHIDFQRGGAAYAWAYREVAERCDADLFIIFARTTPGTGPTGITAFLVERGFEGFTVGKKEDKLGIRASSTCELLLETCRVPRANVLGDIGKGYRVAMETLNEGRIGIGAQMIGLAQGALDHATAYVKERKQFGKTISEFQGVQFQLARAATDVEAGRLMVYNAARLRDAGQPFLKEAAMCKLFASEVAERVASLAVNLFGGYGFVKDYPVEKLYRDAKIGQIYEGTSNLQLQTIARQLLS